MHVVSNEYKKSSFVKMVIYGTVIYRNIFGSFHIVLFYAVSC